MNAKSAATVAGRGDGTVLSDHRNEIAATSGNDNAPKTEHANKFDHDRGARYASLTKRVIDLAGTLALLIFFAPLMLVIFVVVRLDGGPGIYAHERIGKNGVRFKCYKFRSMTPNAERVLQEMLVRNEEFRQDWQANHKLRNDPRVTRVGSFLRHKSLDELPQLFNVLKGDMSLVGPRPITSDEIKRYGGNISYYLKARPGLTGAWQVSGRNNLSYDERVALDVAYTKNWTCLSDLLILLKTVRVVISGRGAG